MPDTNNPAPAGTGEGTAAPSVVDELADILEDQETDTQEAEANTAGDRPRPKADRNAATDDGQDAEPDDASVDADDETSDDDSRTDLRDESGRFVSPKAKVKLADGTTTTVGDLASGHLRQSDYTRKTTELAEQRKAYEADLQRVQQADQQLQAQFERVNWWLEQTRPQKPAGSFADDPIAHGQYREQMEQWQEAQQYWANQRQHAIKERETQGRATLEKHLRSEAEALYKVVPALRDPGKRDKFVTEAATRLADYGIKREEIAGLTDHRMILVLRDAVKYRRLQEKAPKVREDINGKPPIIRGSKRTTPSHRNEQERRQRTERLRKEGTMDAGVAALMDMDL